MLEYLTPREIADEALEALRRAPPETPREHFARLVRMGLIDTRGRLTRLYGGEAEPEIEKADELARPNGNAG
jgi:hypothetical protein